MAYPYNNGYNQTPYYAPQTTPVVPQMAYGQPNAQQVYNGGVQPINGYQQQGQMAQQQMQPPVMPPKTNVSLVTSLTEAMGRSIELNTDIFYADQDKPLIYRVSIDMQGRKTYRTFELKDVTEQEMGQGSPMASPTIDYATKDDLIALREEIMGYASSMGVGTTATAPTKIKKTVTKTGESTDKE